MNIVEVKGVRFRLEGLRTDARTYLEGKLRRIRRRERRALNPLASLVHALLPRDWRREPVEALVEGGTLVVGCAGGVETLALGATGLDIDRDALRVAAELAAHAEGARARFLAASAADLPFPDGSFESILSDNVAEHLGDSALRRHLREAFRVLRPGGRCILTTPNRLFEQPPKDGHVSLHSYAEWEVLLGEAGFRDLRTPRRRSGPLVDLTWKKSLEAGGASRRLLSRRGVRNVTIVAKR